MTESCLSKQIYVSASKKQNGISLTRLVPVSLSTSFILSNRKVVDFEVEFDSNREYITADYVFSTQRY